MVMITNSFDKFPNEPTGLMYEQFGKIGINPATVTNSTVSSLTDVVFDASTEIGSLTYSGNTITRSVDSYQRSAINANFQFNNTGTQTLELVAQKTGTSAWFHFGLASAKCVDVGATGNASSQFEYAIRSADDGRTWIRQSSGAWTQVSDTADNSTYKIVNNRTTVTYYANGSSIGTTTHATPNAKYYPMIIVAQTGVDGSYALDYSGDIITTVSASPKVKQHFIEWFSGKQLPSYWTETDIQGNPATFAMSDSVDGGFSITTGSSSSDQSEIDFNDKRQYAHDGSVFICSAKRVSASSLFRTGLTANITDSNTNRIIIENNSGQTYCRLEAFDGSTGGTSSTTTPADTNWHNFKAILNGSSVVLTVDGVTNATTTRGANVPVTNLQPYFFGQTLTGSSAELSIRYMECYNT